MTNLTTKQKTVSACKEGHKENCDMYSNVGIPSAQKEESYCTCGKTTNSPTETVSDNKQDTIQKYFMDKNNARRGAELWDKGDTEQENEFVLMKSVECKDGFSMSVQASCSHYCQPRYTWFSSRWCGYTHFEVGYPNKKEALLMKYVEDKDNPTQTIYVSVPAEVINKIIAKHGGLK